MTEMSEKRQQLPSKGQAECLTPIAQCLLTRGHATGVGERNMLRSLEETFGREVDFFYAAPNEHDTPI